jgi:predicted ArsR family transcriptional regulator
VSDKPPGDGEELTLFVVPPAPLVRPGDPWTSHAAAMAQTPDHVRPLQARVLLAFYGNVGPMTDEDLIGMVGGSASSIRTRRKEVARFGWVEPCGDRPSKFGRSMLLWRLTDRGVAYVRSDYDTLIELANPKPKEKS